MNIILAVTILICTTNGSECRMEPVKAWESPTHEQMAECSATASKWNEKGYEAACMMVKESEE